MARFRYAVRHAGPMIRDDYLRTSPLQLVRRAGQTLTRRLRRSNRRRLTLIRARAQTPLHFFSDDFGWSRFATGGVRVINLPGTHLGILENPFVRALAAQINNAVGE